MRSPHPLPYSPNFSLTDNEILLTTFCEGVDRQLSRSSAAGPLVRCSSERVYEQHPRRERTAGQPVRSFLLPLCCQHPSVPMTLSDSVCVCARLGCGGGIGMPREEEMVRRLSRPHSTLLCRSTGDPRPRRWSFWLLTLPRTVSGSTAMVSQEETRTVTIRSKLLGKWRRGGSHSCAYLPHLDPFSPSLPSPLPLRALTLTGRCLFWVISSFSLGNSQYRCLRTGLVGLPLRRRPL